MATLDVNWCEWVRAERGVKPMSQNRDPSTSSGQAQIPDINPPPSIEQQDEDCYFDGPYLVFTEAYHLKRGFCCQSGCRHCPYGFGKDNQRQGILPEQSRT
jgi:hypothetical protein